MNRALSGRVPIASRAAPRLVFRPQTGSAIPAFFPAVAHIETFDGADGASVGPDLDWTFDPLELGYVDHAHLLDDSLAMDEDLIGESTAYQAWAANELPAGAPNWYAEFTFRTLTFHTTAAGNTSVILYIGATLADPYALLVVEVAFDGTTTTATATEGDSLITRFAGTIPDSTAGTVIRVESEAGVETRLLVDGSVVLTGTAMAPGSWPGADHGCGLLLNWSSADPHSQGELAIESLEYGSDLFIIP